MKATSKITLDLTQQNNKMYIYAVQGDGSTRAVEVTLLSGGVPWQPDEGWEAAITYRKPDGTKGLYNLLDDGSSAITISGSTATVILAAQMLTVPGSVRAAIVFNNHRLDQLTSFPFTVSVARNQFDGAQQSEDYIRLQWLEDKLEERIAQLISTEQAVRAGAAAQEATAAAAAAQEQATAAGDAANAANTAAASAREQSAAAGNAASAANAAASRADTAAAGANTAKESANTAAAAAQAVVDGIVPEVEQLRSDLTEITPDDTAIDGKPWTSRRIVEALCQPIHKVGDLVQCYPIEGYPMGVTVSLEPKQAGSGDPSPGNVRTITGRNTVQVMRCGKNLLHNMGSKTASGITFDVQEDGSILVNGTATSDVFYTVGGKYPLTTGWHTLSGVPAGGSTATYYMYLQPGYRVDVGNGATFNNSEKAEFSYSIHVRPGTTVDHLVIKPQLELGSKATGYEPYHADTYELALPETVYGGTLEVGSGILTVTHGCIAAYAGEALPGKWLSDRDVYTDGGAPTTGAQVVYELAAPYTIQLTPRQITNLPGTNTIYSDAEGVIVTGREDPKHTITELKNAIVSLGGNV